MTTVGIHWLGHASFRIDDGPRRIYIDPWKLSADAPPADLILITHAHYDHFSPDDIARIRRDSTVICATGDVAAKLPGTVIVSPGGKYAPAGVRVRTTAAYNLGKKFHPKGNGWVGYIVTLQDGRRVYHSGDTDAIPEMRTVEADIALLPCGGTYTMTGEEAAAAANTFRPAVVIPMHWGDIVGAKGDAEQLQKGFTGATELREPERP